MDATIPICASGDKEGADCCSGAQRSGRQIGAWESIRIGAVSVVKRPTSPAARDPGARPLVRLARPLSSCRRVEPAQACRDVGPGRGFAPVRGTRPNGFSRRLETDVVAGSDSVTLGERLGQRDLKFIRDLAHETVGDGCCQGMYLQFLEHIRFRLNRWSVASLDTALARLLGMREDGAAHDTTLILCSGEAAYRGTGRGRGSKVDSSQGVDKIGLHR